MANKKYTLDYAEFYITNVCNLNCERCNRYNNYAFTGHYKWEDHAAEYIQWAELLDIEVIGILGGEPFTNPDIKNWISNVAKLWPNSKIILSTNGRYRKRIEEYMDFLESFNKQIILEISWHGADGLDELHEWAQNLLNNDYTIRYKEYNDGWVQAYNDIKDASWPECNTPVDFEKLPTHIQDECANIHQVDPESYIKTRWTTVYIGKHLFVKINAANQFGVPSVVLNADNTLTTHNSDPTKAIKVCSGKSCHHFLNGKLYKCHVVAVLPEFMNQFEVSFTNKQKELVNSYEPGEVGWDSTRLSKFIDDLNNEKVIPQCSLCPESEDVVEFTASKKKLKIPVKVISS